MSLWNKFVVWNANRARESARKWLITEGSQFSVNGEFRYGEKGEIEYVDENRNRLPVPEWAIVNMLVAYRKSGW